MNTDSNLSFSQKSKEKLSNFIFTCIVNNSKHSSVLRLICGTNHDKQNVFELKKSAIEV